MIESLVQRLRRFVWDVAAGLVVAIIVLKSGRIFRWGSEQMFGLTYEYIFIVIILSCIYGFFNFRTESKMEKGLEKEREGFEREKQALVKYLIESFIKDGDLISDPPRNDLFVYEAGKKLHIIEPAWGLIGGPIDKVNKIHWKVFELIQENKEELIATKEDVIRHFGKNALVN